MTPIVQRRWHVGGGDCFEACVASILEVPIEDVPDWHMTIERYEPGWCERNAARIAGTGHDHLEYPDGAWREYKRERKGWLAERGLALLEIDIAPHGDANFTLKQWWRFIGFYGPGFYWIATTRVDPRFCHATVWCGRQPAWNPTPGNVLDRKVLGQIECVSYFMAIDPARMSESAAA